MDSYWPGAYIHNNEDSRTKLDGLTMANAVPPAHFPSQMRPGAFADFLGVSLRTVQRYIDRGMPVLAGGGKGFAKSIPVAAALAWLSGPPQKRRRGRPPNVSSPGKVQLASPHPALTNQGPAGAIASEYAVSNVAFRLCAAIRSECCYAAMETPFVA